MILKYKPCCSLLLKYLNGFVFMVTQIDACVIVLATRVITTKFTN